MKTSYFPIIGMVLIMVVASLLRVWQLNTHMIFFGDAAHDMLVARQAILNRELPLLGIESSVPRFRQGPVAIWLIMLSQLAFGLTNTYAIALVFACISLAAVIALYEVIVTTVNQKTALISSALMAVFPMAVAHGRVPYHTTPIPLALVLFLWAMGRLWQNKKWSVFLAVLSWALLFQFELALLPLIGVPAYIFWRKKRKLSKKILGQAFAGLTLGLLPQIIFDLTHQFQHLGGFAIWTVYRIVAFGGYRAEHTVSVNRLTKTGTIFWNYFQKIVSLNQPAVALVFLGLLIASLWTCWSLYKAKKLPPTIELTVVSFLLLTVAYIVHGSPSEAYFPPFIVLLAILIGYVVAEQIKNTQTIWLAGIGVGAYMAVTALGIMQHNFFVGTNYSYSYGPSVQEYRQVARYLVEQSDNQFSLNTTAEGGQFASYFDNLRWAHIEQGYPPVSQTQHLFYIERDPTLDTYPSIKKVSFNLLTVYQLL